MANENKGKGKWALLLLLGILGVGGYLLYSKSQKDKAKKDKSKEDESTAPKQTEIVKQAFDNLNFDTGKATIKESSFGSLKALADYLKSIPALALSIEGHTDSVGDEDANLKLSQARSEAVKTYLVSQGVEEKRITAKGFGESKPIAPNTTREGREKNRRVEFIIA